MVICPRKGPANCRKGGRKKCCFPKDNLLKLVHTKNILKGARGKKKKRREEILNSSERRRKKVKAPGL